MIGFKMLIAGVALFGLAAVAAPGPQVTSDVERLKASALKGSVPDAESLSRLRDKPAIEAMREVLQKSDNVQVKTAMILGLGHNNKDLASVPLLLEIMGKDDKLGELRAKANEAVEIIGMTGYFYKPDEPLEERKEKVSKMRLEHKKMQDQKAGPAAVARPMPNAKLLMRESRFKETYQISIPFSENGARMRVSAKYPETARSYHLEIESAPADFNWDWNDLVIRVDINQDGSLKITAVAAITSPYSFDIVDSKGKLLLFDFGPNTQNSSYTFPK